MNSTISHLTDQQNPLSILGDTSKYFGAVAAGLFYFCFRLLNIVFGLLSFFFVSFPFAF